MKIFLSTLRKLPLLFINKINGPGWLRSSMKSGLKGSRVKMSREMRRGRSRRLSSLYPAVFDEFFTLMFPSLSSFPLHILSHAMLLTQCSQVLKIWYLGMV